MKKVGFKKVVRNKFFFYLIIAFCFTSIGQEYVYASSRIRDQIGTPDVLLR